MENLGIAHWAVPWVQQAVIGLSPRVETCAVPKRILHHAIVDNGSQMAFLGSIHANTRSRIMSIACLRLKTGSSMPSSEMLSLLETLGTLSLIDNGYVYSWTHYVISLLSGQPKALDGQRTAVLKIVGRILALSSISDQELRELANNCIKTIPKKLKATLSNEILVTGLLWARIADTKVGLLPQDLIAELPNIMASYSLPKIIASRESVQNCTIVCDLALRIVLALEKRQKSKPASLILRTPLLKLCETVWTNIETIRKISHSEQLEKLAIRVLASLNFENFMNRILAILEEADGYWSALLKKEALKCLFQRVLADQGDEELRKSLVEAASDFLSRSSQSPLHKLCSRIVSLGSPIDPFRGLLLPFSAGSLISSWSAFSDTSLNLESTSTMGESSITCRIRISCPESDAKASSILNGSNEGLESSVVPVISEHDPLALFTRFFDELASADSVLEVFNKYPLHVLEKLDEFLNRSSSTEKRENLDELARILQHHRESKDLSAQSGWFKYYQRFESRPKAQKEVALLILAEPKLLSHSFLLYHLHRLAPSSPLPSLALNVSSSQELRSSTLGLATEEPISNPPHSSSNGISLHISASRTLDMEQENLKKRKELALKMIDDLENEESICKKNAPLEASSPSTSVAALESSASPVDIIILREEPEEASTTSPRVTRSRAKSVAAKTTASAKKSGSKKANNGNIVSDINMAVDDDGESISEVNVGDANIAKNGNAAKKGASKGDKKKNDAKKKEKKGEKVEKKKKEAQKRPVCNHWLQHRCYKGSDCPFLHEGTQLTYDTICKFFRTGNCTKGTACPYSHDLKSEACFNLVSTDHCKFGDRCLYSHDPIKIASAKATLETRRKEEEALKAEQEKEKTLSFVDHLVPISFQPPLIESPFSASPFQPSYSMQYSNDDNENGNNSDSTGDNGAYTGIEPNNRVETEQQNTSNEAAYVPPVLVGINTASFISTPIVPSAPSLLPPPSLSSNPPLKPPSL